jgi:glycosyltransferase involved in cell wall biosynthesis
MTTLRVILDDILTPGGGPLGRYAEHLTRALTETAPRGSDVAGVVAASPEDDYARLRAALPRLRTLHKSALARRELQAAWQHGFTVLPGSGMVHAPGLLAPLRRHDRTVALDDQTVVTIHDALAWTHPELLPSRTAAWTRAMGRRVQKYADAVVVPTHALAAELDEHLQLGARIRVIGTAPTVADGAHAATRDLPERYVVAVAEGDPRNGFSVLAEAASRLDIPVVLIANRGDAASVDGVEKLTLVEDVDDAERAAIVRGAAVYVQPSLAAGPAGALLDAMALGRPVVATDLPAVAEVLAGAAELVPVGDAGALADAVQALLDDPSAAERGGVAAGDRARAFTWWDAADKIWQLHADL